MAQPIDGAPSPPIWDVTFEEAGPLARAMISYRRLLPDGWGVMFEEDTEWVLDIANEEDEHLVMDGFLALIPRGVPLSCAIRATVGGLLGFFRYDRYRVVFAGEELALVQRTFEINGLFNTDGCNPDLLFAGGPPEAHEAKEIERQAEAVKRLLKVSRKPQGEGWEALLRTYTAILYADCTEIYSVALREQVPLAHSRAALAAVAARYRLTLPPLTTLGGMTDDREG